MWKIVQTLPGKAEMEMMNEFRNTDESMVDVWNPNEETVTSSSSFFSVRINAELLFIGRPSNAVAKAKGLTCS